MQEGNFWRKRDNFGILYTGYLLSIVKIKREIKRERREREKKESEIATNNE